MCVVCGFRPRRSPNRVHFVPPIRAPPPGRPADPHETSLWRRMKSSAELCSTGLGSAQCQRDMQTNTIFVSKDLNIETTSLKEWDCVKSGRHTHPLMKYRLLFLLSKRSLSRHSRPLARPPRIISFFHYELKDFTDFDIQIGIRASK